jgi:hypothetical protein
MHLYATAYGWGGLAIEHAAYMPVTRNNMKIEDGTALRSSLTFNPAEVDESRGGFCTVISYDADRWIARGDRVASAPSVAIVDNTRWGFECLGPLTLG